MPRKPRFVLPGVPQHLVQRGNNRDPCFFGEADYRRYLNDLRVSLADNGCALHAYVLMTNHVHLLATPSSEHGLSRLMQDLGRKYVGYINRKYDRSGTLWQGRYKASLVDSEAYLLTCMRYIELNPVRAGMVDHPAQYRWSSYHHNAQGLVDPLIEPHPAYRALDATAAGRHHAYRELFRQQQEPSTLHAIRTALNEELVLGRDDFKDKIEQTVNRQVRRGMDGRPRVKEMPGQYFIFKYAEDILADTGI